MREPSEADVAGIGARVVAARHRLGWTREALAFHSGLSWSGVAQVESGRRTSLRPGTLAALARTLGVTIDYLVQGGPASPMFRHHALIYSSDEEFLDAAGPYLAEGLERSEALLAVTTAANIELLRGHLGRDAREVEFVEAASWYLSPVAALESYTASSRANLDAGAPWVRIVGEPVWAGRTDGEVRLWARYESLLNMAFAAWPLTVVCPYDTRVLDPAIVGHARATHPHMVDPDGLAPSHDYTEPGRFVLDPGRRAG